MSITKDKAWAIFQGHKLGQPEAERAEVDMTDEEMAAYLAFAEEWEMSLAKIGVEAQNEAAILMEGNVELATLMAKPPYYWVAADYRTLVSAFEGSKFEKLHLSAMFRFQNAELLLEMVKP